MLCIHATPFDIFQPYLIYHKFWSPARNVVTNVANENNYHRPSKNIVPIALWTSRHIPPPPNPWDIMPFSDQGYSGTRCQDSFFRFLRCEIFH